jgi:hypothetical protein
MAFKLDALKIAADRTAKYTLEKVDLGQGEPVLDLRYAGEENAAYWRALKKQELANRGKNLSDKEAREMTVKLFAEHIIVGWTNVAEDDGTPTPCTPANVERLLFGVLEYPSAAYDVWSPLFVFANRPANFRDAQPASGADLGKP